MILGQRIRLDPNNVQRSFLERCAGAARFTFNLGLARWREMYAAGEKPNWRKLNAEVNARKASDLAWLREIPWAVSNSALQDLDKAFSHFFRRVKEGSSKPGYPKFRRKHSSQQGFGLDARELRLLGCKVKLPKLGWVRTRQELRFPGKVLAARFTRRAGNWYVSVQVEVSESWPYPHRCETQGTAVGVDLGLRDLAVLSTGERIEAPRSLRTHERKLRRVNKELSRRRKGGKNWLKTKAKLGRLHERIVNIRQDVTHNLTASLVQRFRFIGVENLYVRGMARTRLAKSIHDAALSALLRQLDYKALLAGSTVVHAGRWFASSKTCHVCGTVYAGLTLSERHWTCDACGTEHERDGNASKNLEALALAHRVAACCPGSSGSVEVDGVKLLVEQEEGVCCAS